MRRWGGRSTIDGRCPSTDPRDTSSPIGSNPGPVVARIVVVAALASLVGIGAPIAGAQDDGAALQVLRVDTTSAGGATVDVTVPRSSAGRSLPATDFQVSRGDETVTVTADRWIDQPLVLDIVVAAPEPPDVAPLQGALAEFLAQLDPGVRVRLATTQGIQDFGQDHAAALDALKGLNSLAAPGFEDVLTEVLGGDLPEGTAPAGAIRVAVIAPTTDPIPMLARAGGVAGDLISGDDWASAVRDRFRQVIDARPPALRTFDDVVRNLRSAYRLTVPEASPGDRITVQLTTDTGPSRVSTTVPDGVATATGPTDTAEPTETTVAATATTAATSSTDAGSVPTPTGATDDVASAANRQQETTDDEGSAWAPFAWVALVIGALLIVVGLLLLPILRRRGAASTTTGTEAVGPSPTGPPPLPAPPAVPAIATPAPAAAPAPTTAAGITTATDTPPPLPAPPAPAPVPVHAQLPQRPVGAKVARYSIPVPERVAPVAPAATFDPGIAEETSTEPTTEPSFDVGSPPPFDPGAALPPAPAPLFSHEAEPPLTTTPVFDHHEDHLPVAPPIFSSTVNVHSDPRVVRAAESAERAIAALRTTRDTSEHPVTQAVAVAIEAAASGWLENRAVTEEEVVMLLDPDTGPGATPHTNETGDADSAGPDPLTLGYAIGLVELLEGGDRSVWDLALEFAARLGGTPAPGVDRYADEPGAGDLVDAASAAVALGDSDFVGRLGGVVGRGLLASWPARSGHLPAIPLIVSPSIAAARPTEETPSEDAWTDPADVIVAVLAVTEDAALRMLRAEEGLAGLRRRYHEVVDHPNGAPAKLADRATPTPPWNGHPTPTEPPRTSTEHRMVDLLIGAPVTTTEAVATALDIEPTEAVEHVARFAERGWVRSATGGRWTADEVLDVVTRPFDPDLSPTDPHRIDLTTASQRSVHHAHT